MEAQATKIFTLRGDITKMEGFEAVVNPSNPNLLANGKGVNGVIHEAAGPELEAACMVIGKCEVGNACITEGFNLPYPYVIHAVGPLYREGVGDDEVLVKTYQNTLNLAKEKGIRTLAFASISTGSVNCPVTHIAKIAVDTVVDYVAASPEAFDQICWVLFNYKTKQDYDAALTERGYLSVTENQGEAKAEETALDGEAPLEGEAKPFVRQPFLTGDGDGAAKVDGVSQPLKLVKEDGTVAIIGFFHEYGAEYGCLSNWYKAPFQMAGRTFTSTEQYLMYQKVIVFRKYELAEQVLRSDEPGRAKRLGGATFPEFDALLWDRISYQVLKQGVKEKFRQNPDILEVLLGTGQAILAQCSLRDTKWGIGMDDHDPAWSQVSKWTGRNYYGRILMEVRDELRSEKALFGEVLPFQDYRDAPAIPLWNLTPGELRRLPAFRLPVQTYLDMLPDKKNARNQSFRFTLADIEAMMRMNMGSGLPIPGFYEMKQTVYEIAAAIKE